MSASTPNNFRLGPWMVETDQNQLSSADDKRRLLPRSMQVLVYLAKHHQRVVSSDELIQQLWGERFVGENPLYKHMALLRKSLKHVAYDKTFIRTIPKKGYQLVIEPIFPVGHQHDDHPVKSRWQTGSPYRGLHKFESRHADVFFGRDEMIQRITRSMQRNALENRAFVLLLGSSGSGKSSLIQAGVMPYLSRTLIEPNVANWFNATFTPSSNSKDLLRGLAQSVTNSGLTTRSDDEYIEQLSTALIDTPSDIHKIFKGILTDEEFSSRRLILFVDQLEELFTISNISDKQRKEFVRALKTLAQSGCCWLFAAVRNDYYPRFVELEDLNELRMGDGQIDIVAPSSAEISLMIRQPAQVADLKFERHETSQLRLDDVLRDEAIDQPGSLPLLQFTLDQLYQKRSENRVLTHGAYQSIGGLSGALAQHAEQTYELLSNSAKILAAKFFNSLVDVDPGNGQRTKIPYVPDASSSEERELLDKFIENRLLVSELGPKQSTVISLVHEALIRHWPRLRSWLDESEDLLRIRSRVRNSAERWRKEKKRADLLLPTGRRMQEALALKGSQHIDTSRLVNDYIEQSERASMRRTRVRRVAVSGVVIAAMLTSISAYLAASSRDYAREQQAQAEDLISFMVGDLREKLVPVGRLDVLDSVGDKALNYFEAQNLKKVTEASLINRSQVLEQLGQVRLQEGDLDKALNLFEQGLDSTKEIVARDAQNLDALFSLGNAHYWVGFVHWKLGDLNDTQHHWTQYHTHAVELVNQEPESETWKLELSYALNNLGTIAIENNDFEIAKNYFEQSVETKIALLESNPENLNYQIELADSLSWLASSQSAQGQLTESRNTYLQVLQETQRSFNENQTNRTIQYRLGLAHQHVANMLVNFGQLDQALDHFAQAEAITKDLIEHDIKNLRWLRDLFYVQSRTAQVLLAQNQSERAVRLLADAHQGIDGLIEQDPSNRSWRQLRAIITTTLAYANSAAHTSSQSQVNMAQAIEDLSEDLQSNPNSSTSKHWLIKALIFRYQIHQKASDSTSNQLADQISHLIDDNMRSTQNPLLLSSLVAFNTAIGQTGDAIKYADTLYAQGYREAEFLTLCRNLGRCPPEAIIN